MYLSKDDHENMWLLIDGMARTMGQPSMAFCGYFTQCRGHDDIFPTFTHRVSTFCISLKMGTIIIGYSVSMTLPCFVENTVTVAVLMSYLTCLRIRSESRTIVADFNLWSLPLSDLFVLSMNVSERISRFTAH